MATAQTVLNSMRWDLRDYGEGIQWDDEELLVYLNRMKDLLDSELASVNSEFVNGVETSIDTVASQNYVDISAMNSGLWDSIKQVWIGSDRLEWLNIDEMYYKRKFISGDRYPYYWSLEGTNIIFETGADSAHTDLVIHYNKKTADLTLTDSMPYNDIFNEVIREATVRYARSKAAGQLDNIDNLYYGMFKQAVFAENMRRNYRPKSYYMDW
jgi:hypothetical protein